MKPYYEHAGITIYHGDCREILPTVKADVLVTDPPYGVGWDYKSTDDTKSNLARLVAGFLPLARDVAPVVLVTCGIMNHRAYPPPEWMLCWFVAAGTGCVPWGFGCWQPILAYGKDPYLKAGKGSRPDGMALTEAAPDVAPPCPKPVKVWTWLCERATPNADATIYDPFLGSGTTLVACTKLDRICFGMDVEPRYVSVAVKRWQDFTGRKATLEATGETFD